MPNHDNEHLRPRASFTTENTWINDPNGPIYIDGMWHVFFQHNPFGSTHQNISWGHAVSSDLLQWEELPVAIAAKEHEQIFSGSVVRDTMNVSQLGTHDCAPLIAFYTSAFGEEHPCYPGIQAQSIAYSLDNGLTWTPYVNNPILNRHSKDFRDPKVFWWSSDDGTRGHWVMVVVEAQDRQVLIYTSDNLLQWTEVSNFSIKREHGMQWECPDLFPLPIDGEGTTRWVMIVSINPGAPLGGSATSYFVGTFDGERFVADTDAQGDARIEWLDYGTDYYAATTFAEAPNGERVCIAWQNNWDYAAQTPVPWRSSLAIPRRLVLTRCSDGMIRVAQKLMTSHQNLIDRGVTIHRAAIDMDSSEDTEFVLSSRDPLYSHTYLHMRIDTQRRLLELDRSHSGNTHFAKTFVRPMTLPLRSTQSKDEITIIVDGCVVTVFANGGTDVLTALHFPLTTFDMLSIETVSKQKDAQ